MSASTTTLGPLEVDVDRSVGTLAVAVGDVLAITLLVAIGTAMHGTDPLARPLYVADAAAPFLIGWVPAAILTGSYAPAARRSLLFGIGTAGLAWVVAVLVGQVLRATAVFHGDAALTFALVMGGLGLLTLSSWRALVGVVE